MKNFVRIFGSIVLAAACERFDDGSGYLSRYAKVYAYGVRRCV